MTTFRYKNNKLLPLSKNMTTLELEHKKKENHFQNVKQSLPKKKKELQNLIEKLNELDNNNVDYTDQNISDKAIIKDDIALLHDEISKIENNTDEINYYFNTYKVISDYYDENNNENTNNAMANNILDFFGNNKQERTKVNNKASLLDTYNTLIDNTYTSKTKNNNVIRICSKCNIEKILNQSEGLYECTNCGEIEIIIIDSTIPSYKESTPEPITYAYRRINHQLFIMKVVNSKLIIIM
jgi:predicted RNA-binding Zn-ribbon protein involved in translation (DUF1610 family)